MSGYLSIPVLIVVVILQATVIPEVRFAGGMPDLVFLIVLAWALMGGLEQGLVWAVVGGILQDLISAVPLGTTSLALVITVTAAALIFGRLDPRSLFYPLFAAAGGTVVLHLVVLVVLLLVGRALPIFDTLTYVTLPTIVYNTVGMIIVYRIVGAFYIASRPRRVEGL